LEKATKKKKEFDATPVQKQSSPTTKGYGIMRY